MIKYFIGKAVVYEYLMSYYHNYQKLSRYFPLQEQTNNIKRYSRLHPESKANKISSPKAMSTHLPTTISRRMCPSLTRKKSPATLKSPRMPPSLVLFNQEHQLTHLKPSSQPPVSLMMAHRHTTQPSNCEDLLSEWPVR